MDFVPLSDQQLRELNLYPEGIYRFQVMRTTQKHSQNSGNDYFNLKMRIWVDGKERILFDMLFFEGKMLYKTKHFCEVAGMPEKYNSGKIMPTDCDGKEGYLELVHRTNTQTGELQNSVKDYVIPEGAQLTQAESKNDSFNDDISF